MSSCVRGRVANPAAERSRLLARVRHDFLRTLVASLTRHTMPSRRPPSHGRSSTRRHQSLMASDRRRTMQNPKHGRRT